MSDLFKAMELTIDLRRGFKAIADCFGPEKAERIFLGHIAAGTSIGPEQASALVAALRDDYVQQGTSVTDLAAQVAEQRRNR